VWNFKLLLEFKLSVKKNSGGPKLTKEPQKKTKQKTEKTNSKKKKAKARSLYFLL